VNHKGGCAIVDRADVNTPKGEKKMMPADEKAAAAQVLADYYRAFSSLNAQAVWPYFNEPSQLVSPAGVVATPTRAAVAAAFQPVMDALRARGFAKSELINLHVKRLSATTMIAGGVAVRTKIDGQELERAGVVYLLQKTNGEWQIATIVIHEANDPLRPE
jgi:ketosteroid isomerase-like protein